MKYKVGDVVKLKSKEELMKLGTWYEPCAEVCGGKSYKIEEFVENSYRSENTTFDEESIECLVSEAEMQKQEATYTFDELKKRVDSLKDYATKLSSELNVELSIKVKTDIDVCRYSIVKGSSSINIIRFSLTETDVLLSTFSTSTAAIPNFRRWQLTTACQ